MYRNYLITGATGLIGRHILFELLYAFLTGELTGNIVLLIRSKKGKTAEERIREVLTEDIPALLSCFTVDTMLQHIRCIEGNVNDRNLADKWHAVIEQQLPLCVIHSAGAVVLSTDARAERAVYDNNYRGTGSLIVSLSQYKVKFCFISTAFSSGVRGGTVENELLDATITEFRNPYERYKAIVERKLHQYCHKKRIELQILRPSIVCGRLVEAPFYYTSKFDVFYGFAKYFWYLKQKNNEDVVRVQITEESVLNIVPVDYVAKAIVRALPTDICELNIAHRHPVPVDWAIRRVLGIVGAENYALVTHQPVGMNKTEKAYYRIVHNAFGPYLTAPASVYNCRLLDTLMEGVALPNIHKQFEGLITYAIDRAFSDEVGTVSLT